MFSNQLKFYRNNLRLTQKEMAIKLNITRQCYSGYELGKREPNFEVLRKLCVVFGCTADELLEIDTPEARKNVIINESKKESEN